MKKIISILIATVLLLSGICIASATDTTDIDIYTLNDYVKITVTTQETVDVLTLRVQSTTGNTLLYAKEKNAPDETEQDGTYKYNFEFYVSRTAASNPYRAYVGGLSQIEFENFKLILSQDKKAFYNALDDEAAADIPQYFSDNEFYLPGEFSEFDSINSDLKDLICTEIDGMELEIAADESNLLSVDEAFTTLYKNRVICAYVVQETDVLKWDGYVSDLAKGGNLLTDYYDQLEPSTVHRYFGGEKEVTVEEAKIVSAIDKAVLLSIADDVNASILRDAVGDYRLRASMSGVDFSDYDSLDDDEKLTVCEAIRNGAPDTFEKFVDLLEDEAEKLANGVGGGLGGLGGVLGGGLGGGGATVGKEFGKENENETQKPAPQPVAFSDIENVSWAKEAIDALAQIGVISGKGSNKFCPDDNVTREEFAKMLVEAFGLKDTTANVNFQDVPKEKWSYVYIASAYNCGIVNGTGENSFGAQSNIIRQDMAVMICRTLELAGVDMAAVVPTFSDSSQISSYARKAVASLSDMGVVNGMGDGTFAPKNFVTRAQAAKIIYEALLYFENH